MTHAQDPALVEAAAPLAGRAGFGRGLDRLLGWLAVLLAVGMVSGALGAALLLAGFFDSVQVRTTATVFVAIIVQALPFLMLGTVVSGAITAFVSPAALRRVFPRDARLAVPAAAAMGALLPGCECASVPVARGLIQHGVAPAATLTFLLAAPAINPVVLVSTAVAYPGRPQVVLARLVASLATAIITGWVWLRRNDGDLLAVFRRAGATDAGRQGRPAWAGFVDAMRADLLSSGGFLVVGALLASIVNTALPQSQLGPLAHVPGVAVVCLALLAVIVAVCSEADAFVAAGLTGFPLPAQLAFMVVGPAVDLKLVALQAGTFGARFALRFAPLTLATATACAAVIGWIVL